VRHCRAPFPNEAFVTDVDTPPPSAGDLEPETEAFDAVCRRLAGFDERIDTEWVDGYLTAVAAGPRAIGIDEWLPAMCGDAFARAFADPADVAQASAALRARAGRLQRELDPERLLDDDEHVHIAPLMQVWDDSARAELVVAGHASADEAAGLHTGAVWALGFFAAIEDFPADWPDPGDDDEMAEAFDAMLQTVAALAWDPAGEPYQDLVRLGWKDANPTRDELIDEACFAVQDLRLYWLDHAPTTPPRRVAAVPGRNDPCPCGSGKKYKRCHGAA